MRVQTFNVRTSAARDGKDAWPHRRAFALRTIADYAPDLLAVQEPMPDQWEDIARANPQLEGIAGDVGAPWDGQHWEGLFYRRDRFTALAQGQFWISPTPAEKGSILYPNHWGPRIVVWVRLRDRETDRELLFCCTHFDTHPGAGEPSAAIVTPELERLAAGAPVILAGDFNMFADMPGWRAAMQLGWADAWRDAGQTDHGVVTFHGFRPAAHPVRRPPPGGWHNERMDWVLFKGPLRARRAAVDTRLFGGRPASDHYAVNVELDWTS